jgi:predicted nucleotidyltransferase component of viral defense system
MVEIKELSKDEFNQIVVEQEFNRDLLLKDYYITMMLYFLKDINGLVFKGGTALQKTFLEYSRLSEDIDFTLKKDINIVKKEIIKILDKSKIFGKISKDKDVMMFTRLIVPYNTNLGKGEIFIDLNEKSKLLTKPENFDMKHFYSNIPKFDFLCLSQKEMVGEKVAAAIGRNKPRDHYDIYQIIKHKIPIDMKIVKEKCMKSGSDPSILKMFNKAKKLYKKWGSDIFPLIKEDIKFQEVMQTLAKYFNLKQEKDKLKKK